MNLRDLTFALLFLIKIIKGANIISTKDLKEFNVKTIHRLIQEENWNCTDVVSFFLERAYIYNPKIRAIINFNPNAMVEAKKQDDFFYSNGKKLLGRLHCIPILVKDNIDVSGLPTSGGIKTLRYSIPNKDALVVKRLRDEGAIILAKTNLAELAAGPYDSELGGECLNPWDYTRSCGPSSTGSGAGISSGMGVIGLGTDTEGSIMNPSAFGSLFGLRPPHGILSMDGIFPAFMKQDVVGPMSKYFNDMLLAYSIMSGNISIYDKIINKNLISVLKIGIVNQFYNPFNVSNMFGNFTYIIDKQVKSAIQNALENLEKLGLEVVKIDISQDTFNLLNNISSDIVIERQFNCVLLCVKDSINDYLNKTDRFEYDSPFHKFDDLLLSPYLTKYWNETFSKSNIDDPAHKCEIGCSKYEKLRQDFTQIVKQWYDQNGIQALVFPTINDLPYVLKDIDKLINISPTFLSPYTKYAALSIPIGFSKETTDAPDGLPIGMMLLTPNENLYNVFKIATKYSEIYPNSNQLPSNTPRIEKFCLEKSNSYILKSSSIVIIGLVSMLFKF